MAKKKKTSKAKATGRKKPVAKKPVAKKAAAKKAVKQSAAQSKYHAVQKAVSEYYKRFGVKPGREGYRKAVTDVWKVSKDLTKKEAVYLRTINPVLEKRVKTAKAKIKVKYTVKDFPGLDVVKYYELTDALEKHIPDDTGIRVRLDMTGVGLGVIEGTKSKMIEEWRRVYLQRFRDLDAQFPELKIYYEPWSLENVDFDGKKYTFEMEFETIPQVIAVGKELQKEEIRKEIEPEPEPELIPEPEEIDERREQEIELRKIEKEEAIEKAKLTIASLEKMFDQGKITYEQYLQGLERLK